MADGPETYERQYGDLKKRLRDAESQNEEMVLRIQRTKKLIQRARLERTILLERLEHSTGLAADPETVESPPMSPIEPAALNTSVGAATNDKKKENSERKRGTPRDPRLPKRPQNAYIIFCDSERERVRKEIEDKGTQTETHDLTRAMAEAWKVLGAQGRKKYTELYQEDRLRYLKEMASFPSNGLNATDQKEKQRALKQLRDLKDLKDLENMPEKNGEESDEDNTEDEKSKGVKKELALQSEEPPSEPPLPPSVPDQIPHSEPPTQM